jgi:predicted phage-related endonuclease
MSDRPNTPVPDELAAVRADLKRLTTREAELRQILLSDPDTRTGADYLVEIKTVKQDRTDLKELRACHPDIVEQFTFPVEITRIELRGINDDGEIVSLRRKTA